MVSGKESTFSGMQSTFLGMQTTFLGSNLKKKHFLVVGSSLVVPWFILGSSLVFYKGKIQKVQRYGILKIVRFFSSGCFALLSLFSRSSVAKIRQGIRKGERDDNINKTHFFSLGVLWQFLGSSLVHPWSLTRSIYKVQGEEFLRKGIRCRV